MFNIFRVIKKQIFLSLLSIFYYPNADKSMFPDIKQMENTNFSIKAQKTKLKMAWKRMFLCVCVLES